MSEFQYLFTPLQIGTVAVENPAEGAVRLAVRFTAGLGVQ